MIDELIIAGLGFLAAALSWVDVWRISKHLTKGGRLLKLQRILAGITYLGVAYFWVTREQLQLSLGAQLFDVQGAFFVRIIVCALCLLGGAEIVTRWELPQR